MVQFDKIILTQCNEIITIIIGEETKIRYKENKFEEILNNLNQIYQSLQDQRELRSYGIQNNDILTYINTREEN